MQFEYDMLVFVFELFNRSLIIPILQPNFEGLSRSEMQKAGLNFWVAYMQGFYVCANLWAVQCACAVLQSLCNKPSL